jgi:diguanylate cyclase (GGDEF)-like protein/PAS domain S-box-containing protein
MRRWLLTQDQRSLPVDIYASSVNALYADSRSLYAGTISAAAAAAVTAWKVAEPLLFACSLLLTLIGWARARDISAYSRRKPASDDFRETRRWEKRYIVGSGAFVAVLSLWCFLTFALTADPAAHLISFSVSLAYLVGVTGRNFSSDQLVTTQAICAGPPMIAGLIIQQDVYYAFLASLLIPFFLSLKFISARLRKTLFDAVVAKRDIESLAQRFDTALNNMPHGLCMFDLDGRLLVSNQRFAEILGLSPAISDGNTKARDLLQQIVDTNKFDNISGEQLINRFEQKISAKERKTLLLEGDKNVSLELTFQPMESGGCVVLAEDITERRQAAEKIEHLARYDSLTGLPNRVRFQDDLESLIAGRSRRHYALLFIDLDQFKKVNDTLGHPFGDALLCQVADRLRHILNPTNIVARFGGDEFVVLQPLLHSTRDAAETAQRIIDTLSEIYEVNGHQIVIGASIGIGLMPEHGDTFDQILKCADMALYRAKADGRGAYRFFEHDMDEAAQARRVLELDIRNALTRNEFEIYYQPIVNIKTGLTTACEALLRWSHPTRGMVPPQEFIPVAEEMGLITELGTQVLRQACAQCATWPESVGVAVNMSAIQFRRSDVPAIVASSLLETGLSPDRLEIEITESVLLEDIIGIQQSLDKLRWQGVGISLDDFGTGYSSLSYLSKFPLSKIKIDRSFLIDIEDSSRSLKLLQGVARMSADLGMSVVAEGVETHQQLALLLQEPSITEVQGFLFSRPLNNVDIRDCLQKEKPALINVA